MADTTRLSQLVTEVVSTGEPETRLSQLVTEVVSTGEPETRLSQLVTEVIRTGEPKVKVPQVAVEVMYETPIPIGYFTDFSEYTVGQTLEDWSSFFTGGTLTYTAESNSGLIDPAGSNYLRLTATTAGEHFITWDDLIEDVNTDLLVGFNKPVDGNIFNILFRAFGDVDGNDYNYGNGWAVRFTDTALYLLFISHSGYAVIGEEDFTNTGEEYWIRLHIEDTSMRVKLWSKDTMEPYFWTIEVNGTAADTPGRPGLGLSGSSGYVNIDYFGIVSEIENRPGLVCPFPPSGFNPNTVFSTTTVPTTTTASVAGAWGHFIKSSGIPRTLDSIKIWCGQHNDQIRIGLYIGGTETSLSHATLLKDFGITSGSVVNDWIEILCNPALSIPVNTNLWLIFKGDNPDGFYMARTSNSAHHGSTDSGTGIYTLNDYFPDLDPETAFNRTLLDKIPVQGSNYYKFKIGLGVAPEKIGIQPLVFKIES